MFGKKGSCRSQGPEVASQLKAKKRDFQMTLLSFTASGRLFCRRFVSAPNGRRFAGRSATTRHFCYHGHEACLRLLPYAEDDENAVFRLLSFLPSLYPNGHEWLRKRLGDVLNGTATCILAKYDSHLVGITIEKPKSQKRLKLCTIFVMPAFRQLGVGMVLLSERQLSWKLSGYDEVYVTGAMELKHTLSPFFGRFGFNLVAIEKNRYGKRRDEIVFSWRNRQVKDVEQPYTHGFSAAPWHSNFRAQQDLQIPPRQSILCREGFAVHL